MHSVWLYDSLSRVKLQICYDSRRIGIRVSQGSALLSSTFLSYTLHEQHSSTEFCRPIISQPGLYDGPCLNGT